jgi:hypothetical protein
MTETETIYLISEVIDLGTRPLYAYRDKNLAEEALKMGIEVAHRNQKKSLIAIGYTEEEAENWVKDWRPLELDELELS